MVIVAARRNGNRRLDRARAAVLHALMKASFH